MMLATAPTLTNNIIGPWAIIRRDWASYIPTSASAGSMPPASPATRPAH